jgi:hypothetical protein
MMKFVDQLYELYKNRLSGDEEDAMIIVSSILTELDREHLMEIIREMSYAEMYEMLGTYLVNKLHAKLIKEGAAVPEEMGPMEEGPIH